MNDAVVHDGWYLMSIRDLEVELARARGDHTAPPSNAVALSIEEALAYKAAGNLPDTDGRSLRLVLHIRDEHEFRELDERRLRFEPDMHDPPTWKRDGSAAITVVPLRGADVGPLRTSAWWEEPDIAELESEWQQNGTAAGLKIPGEFRSFVYKTIVALRKAGIEITADSVAASVARWTSPDDAERIKLALKKAQGN